MERIAVVDDRNDHRETIRRNLSTCLPDGWECIDSRPLMDPGAYLPWLAMEAVRVLIIDERLHEDSGGGGTNVQYAGHELVTFLRGHLPSLPIVVVTTYPEDPDLLEAFGAVDEIIDRDEFNAEIEQYSVRLVRHGTRFSEERDRHLAELGELSARIAGGLGSAEDRSRAHELQTSLAIAVSPLEPSSRDLVLDKIESSLGRLERALADSPRVRK